MGRILGTWLVALALAATPLACGDGSDDMGEMGDEMREELDEARDEIEDEADDARDELDEAAEDTREYLE